MKWKDVQEIAISLAEKHPDIDPLKVNFVDLHNFVVGLDDFDDDHSHGGEKVLEAIQATWIDETE
ncbi:MAG: Fe-S cluster assembly protein IscX [Sideroxydans sp.]|jgi:FeS assembly protein IscX